MDLPTGSIIVWSLALIGALIVGFAVVTWVRRKTLTGGDTSTGGGFTLAELRQLHRQGKLTAGEFEKAKSAILPPTRPSAPSARNGPTDKE